MSQHERVIAVRQRTAIMRVPEDTMTSPYLDRIRSTREILEDLIAAREDELAKTTAAMQRRRVERDLTFLRDELARVNDKAAAGGSRCEPCNSRRIASR
jgi:hypothetical protein